MKMENKNHWYDGWFYDFFIAPNQDKSFSIIKNIIEENSEVIDIGFGTGRLEFQLSNKCKKIIGIDLSIKNVNTAKNILTKSDFENIEFHHSDIESYIRNFNKNFDYAVISFMIHEVDENLRIEILNSVSKISKQIILLDYVSPQPKGLWKYLNEVVEFAAGRDHYKNYKNYLSNNGLKGLAEKANLKINKEIKNKPVSSHILVLEKY